MKNILIFILLLFSTSTNLIIVQGSADNYTAELDSQDDQCPPWFYYNNITEQCECYRSPSTDHIVLCTDEGALLRNGYCMTYEVGKGTFASRCIYFEVNGHNKSETFPGFITLPDNVSELNDYMCGPMNRKGLVCRECIEEFGLSFFSVTPICTKCSDGTVIGGIFLYLLLAIVPATLVYFFILLFGVGLTSPLFITFMFYCQFVYIFIVYTSYDPDTTLNIHSHANVYVRALITFYGFWDLDLFFTYFIPPLCISDKFNLITILYLKQYSFLFGSVLIFFLTHLCTKLHKHNLKTFVRAWHKISILMQKLNRNPRGTYIAIIYTYFYLMYSKIVEVYLWSNHTTLYDNHNYSIKLKQFLYAEPTIELFSFGHVIIITIQVFIILIYTVLLVLIFGFYPVKKFRIICFKIVCSGHFLSELNTYHDKLHSSYKDGLDGERDLRAFSALNWVLKSVFVIIITVYSLVPHHSISLPSILVVLFGSTALLTASVRPYKRNYLNIIDTLLFADLAFCSVMIEQVINFRSSFAAYVAVIAVSVPMWAFICFIVYKTFRIQSLFTILKKKLPSYQTALCTYCFKIKNEENQFGSTAHEYRLADFNELPDRVLNPEAYEGDYTL